MGGDQRLSDAQEPGVGPEETSNAEGHNTNRLWGGGLGLIKAK